MKELHNKERYYILTDYYFCEKNFFGVRKNYNLIFLGEIFKIGSVFCFWKEWLKLRKFKKKNSY